MINVKLEEVFLVEWIDSFGCSSTWGCIDELKKIKPEICLSVGYKIFEDIDYVIICPHIAPRNESIGKEGDDGMGEIAIPKVSIKTMYRLIKDVKND